MRIVSRKEGLRIKCFYHPKDDAVAICKSCGRGICQECTMIIFGNSCCKTCVETSRVPSPTTQFPTEPTPLPRPTGIPSRSRFIVGAVGVIISGVAALPLLFGSGYPLLVAGPSYASGNIVFTIVSIILGVGLLLAGVGYLGIRRNYGPGTGTAAFALSIVAAVLFFWSAAINIIVASTYSSRYYYSSLYYVIVIALFILTNILFGVMQILWGVAHINTRRYTGNSGLAMATGIILIISGSLTASVLVSSVGFVLFFVCSILALIVFVMSKVPQQQVKS